MESTVIWANYAGVVAVPAGPTASIRASVATGAGEKSFETLPTVHRYLLLVIVCKAQEPTLTLKLFRCGQKSLR